MVTEQQDTVQDIADAWDAKLSQAEADPDSGVSGIGSHVPVTNAVDQGPKVKTEDVAPLIKATGSTICRIAEVSDLTAEEVEGIAEPAAHLLTILAPNMPNWAVPAMVLSARLGAVYAARVPELRRKQAQEGDDERPAAQIVDEFPQ